MNHTRPRRIIFATSAPSAAGSSSGDVRAAGTFTEYHPEQTLSEQSSRVRVTVEAVIYVVLGALAILTRFWDLSTRALHHDESLHAYFSWLYAVGQGYVHDPLMHGPTLFHADALAFLLFGDNDYVSRIWPALLGVILVLLPALLRGPNQLGRWGALACSVFLLLSPSMLYYTRYIRHDPFVLVTTLTIVIACLRYMEKPERRWVITVGIMAGLLFATMEVSFIVAFILVTFVLGVVTWQVSRAAFGVVAGAGGGLAAVWLLMPRFGAPPLPSIPWEHPTGDNIRAFAVDLVVHPTFLAAIGVLVLGIVATLSTLERARNAEESGWLAGVLGNQPPGSTGAALLTLLTNRRTLWLAIGLGLTAFVALYTSMFTNMAGLASGTVGALGYWLGQHDVQRAEQPWFYYLVLMAQYEFVAVLLFPIAIGLTIRRLVPAVLFRRPVDSRTYLRGFALYWAFMNLAIYSWAGEKMPWLTVHTVLPLAILAASVVGSAAESVERAVSERQLPTRFIWVPAAGILLLAAGWFALWSWASAGPWVRQGSGALIREMRPIIVDHPWILYLPILALVALIVWSGARMGPRLAASVLGIAAVGMLLVAQTHVGFRMSYQEGDTPKDMLIYVQTSPDVTRVMSDIGTLSRELTGGKDMVVSYDSGTSWPFQWYLRNYPNRHYFGTTISQTPDAPVVLIANDNLTAENLQMLSGYTYTEYAMRWWFPEDETYRKFAIAPELNNASRQNYQTDQKGPFTAGDVVGSVWHSVWGMRDPAEQAKMFRLVAFRELWAPIGSYNFRVYIRNDLLTTWNAIRY